jgi:Tfp pilus tip-associated adhesin PilY1
MKKKTAIASFLIVAGLLALLTLGGPGLKADDREIFSASVRPYIMFNLDNSGSMDTSDFEVASADLASFQTYTLNCASPNNRTYTFSAPYGYNSTYRRYGYWAKRITALKRVVIELMDQTRNDVLFGFAHFFYPADVEYTERVYDSYYRRYILRDRVFDGTSRPDGAIIRNGITDLKGSANDASLKAMCDTVYGFAADGNTPVAESMDSVYGYFAGTINSSDGNWWTDRYGNTRIPSGSTPPNQYTCQHTYMLVVSDGEPTDDAFDAESVRDYYANTSTGYTTIPTHSYMYPYTGATLTKVRNPSGLSADIPAVAKWMYDNPVHDPVNTTVYPDQGISTWAVGMHLSGDGRTNLITACDNAHGRGMYYDGDDYAQLKDNLITAIGSIISSNYAFTSYTSPKKLTTSGSDYVAYQGYFFNKANTIPIWEGHLKCLAIEPFGTSYRFVPQWDSASIMFTQGESGRTLNTTVPASYGSGKFDYTAYGFTTTNAAALLKSLNAADTTQATKIIRYIRGDMTATGRNITATSSQYYLADIFHSDIVYVGRPPAWKALYDTSACNKSATSTDTDCFQYYYNQVKDRQPAVYVGTNDGVVHTINASKTGTGAGQEMNGYIPDEILPKLKNIAISETYTYTTDGRMTVADIYSPTNKWQTVLVFGLREGGRAFYCRNITNPSSTSHKWKFPDYVAAATLSTISGTTLTVGSVSGTFAVGQYLVNEKRTARTLISAVSGSNLTVASSANLTVGDKVLALPALAKYVGATWSKPVIGRLKYKKGAVGTLQDVWVTIVTGGYGPGSDEQGKGLFILDADSGAVIWYLAYAATSLADSSDYYVKNVAALNFPIPQGITAVDLNNDTYIDTIYFANTGGHLFKLNLANALTSTWIPRLLFQGTSGTTQPVFLCPSVSFDPTYKLWLHWGTGNRNSPQSSPKGQFFAVRDDLTSTSSLTTANLQQLTWTLGTSPAPDTMSTTTDPSKKGWYFDFLDTGEILFDPDPLVIPDQNTPYLYFNTYCPSAAVSGSDPCGSGGNMHLYSIRLPASGTGGFPMSGIREQARIAGGGLMGQDYVMYVNTSSTGSITIKRFQISTLQYPGGVFYFKEITR